MIDPRVTTEYTPEQLLAMVARTEFRDFTRSDWDGWAGCESKNPMYGEYTHPDTTPVRVTMLVLDGATVNAVDVLGNEVDDYGGRFYSVAATD